MWLVSYLVPDAPLSIKGILLVLVLISGLGAIAGVALAKGAPFGAVSGLSIAALLYPIVPVVLLFLWWLPPRVGSEMHEKGTGRNA